jgi:hypothetical protein
MPKHRQMAGRPSLRPAVGMETSAALGPGGHSQPGAMAVCLA